MRKGLSPNIRLSYLFRDAGNYKTFGFVILRNPSARSVEELDKHLRRFLIDGAYFYPEQVQLPVLQDSRTKACGMSMKKWKVVMSTGSKLKS